MNSVLKELVFDQVTSRTDGMAQTFLLQQRNGRPYSRKLVERITARWGERARVPKCTPHRFRHTFGTALLWEGVDQATRQRLMGHTDPKSTMVYTKVYDEQMVAAVDKLPWGRK